MGGILLPMDLNLLHLVLLSFYLLVLLVICVYGFHRYILVYLYYRHQKNKPQLQSNFSDWPRVTVQLPMYNERIVARRIIESACRMDYPRDRLQVQVLDDSTDDTTAIAAETVERMRSEGYDVVLRHRVNRTGYKAGALREALPEASGDFVCIFDADFIPTRSFVKDTIHYFTDSTVGMVQVRWDHLNRDQSWLTQTQGFLLDGHFVMEHGARNRSGRFINFNGTAGMWRKATITDSGNWQDDTLAEDLDLSYRAQLKGWRFVFLPEVTVPAELPPEMPGFKTQQYRWAKGGAQTCKKLLPAILRSDRPLKVKAEAFMHLTGNVVSGFVVLLAILMYPVMYLGLQIFEHNPVMRIFYDATLVMLATFSASSFYVCGQRELHKSWWDSLKYLPFMMSLGIGIAINNALAMLDGFFGKPSEFVRTPKYGFGAESPSVAGSATATYRVKTRHNIQAWIELGMGIYMSGCMMLSFYHSRISLALPFLFLFAGGYLYVALSTLLHPLWRRHLEKRLASSLS